MRKEKISFTHFSPQAGLDLSRDSGAPLTDIAEALSACSYEDLVLHVGQETPTRPLEVGVSKFALLSMSSFSFLSP
jgi:hypothetical protein